MEIQKITETSFKKYGRVIPELDVSDLIDAMKNTPVPEEVIYVPSVPELESCSGFAAITRSLYGDMPIQIGYCNGHNKYLNAVEYHRDSEINVAVTDLVLLLGSQQDIESDYTYDTSKIEAFLVPAGSVVELYATTLHYAPCHVEDSGFQDIIVLPRGTNTDLGPDADRIFEDQLLFARNKWLIAHPEAKIEKAFAGLKGENIKI